MKSSNLESPGDRFLSLSLQFALDEQWLSPVDVCEEFPPETLMSALESNDALRAKVLVEAAGVHAKIAAKKSISAAAEDLALALEEGICTPESILTLLPADDLVRYLERDAIWTLVTRDQFWLQDGVRPQARMLSTIKTALEQDLLDQYRLLRAITSAQIASDLPRELLEKALKVAIDLGLSDAAFDPSAVFDSLPLEEMLEHLPLAHVWETVVSGEVVNSAGLRTIPSSPDGSGAPRKTKSNGKSNGNNKKRSKPDDDVSVATTSATLDVPPGPSGDAEELARSKAVTNLRAIDRLPVKIDTLRSPVLLGLDAMYADLLSTESDEDRADLIREAFPNPKMLEEALYAMAETLDPRLTEEALQARGADTSSLIQLVLFEERRRANRAAGITPSAPPPPVMKPGSVPPPPPNSGTSPTAGVTGVPPLPAQARRASTPPPPLPAQARRAR